MTEDREVLREVWHGRIPTAFILASEDMASSLGPETFYLMLPRLSYFALCTDKVKTAQRFCLMCFSKGDLHFRSESTFQSLFVKTSPMKVFGLSVGAAL